MSNLYVTLISDGAGTGSAGSCILQLPQGYTFTTGSAVQTLTITPPAVVAGPIAIHAAVNLY